ncbi:MAG: YceI family protein [Melioribacteraceae bacterium]
MIKNILVVLLLASSIQIFAEEWNVKKSNSNMVKFISSTTVLDFEGVTSNIDGYLYWEGEKMFSGNNELYFEVDINSIETGSGKRDRDMREDVLETDKWQTTYFKGKIISSNSIEKNKYEIKAVGKMFIHGIENEKEIDAELFFNEGILNVKTNFSVLLKDYKIKAPSLLAFIKVAEEIKLNLNFILEKSEEK